jgi:uncharacterized protein YdhG (YjbR/CyaY superfamily)
MQSQAKTVAEYLNGLPEDRRSALLKLRALIQEAAPNAVECMRWGMPTYELGKPLCAFAAHKNDLALYLLDTGLVERFQSQLGALSVSKGCIRFRRFEQLPEEVVGTLLEKAVQRRMAGLGAVPCESSR